MRALFSDPLSRSHFEHQQGGLPALRSLGCSVVFTLKTTPFGFRVFRFRSVEQCKTCIVVRSVGYQLPSCQKQPDQDEACVRAEDFALLFGVSRLRD